jgi:hypothetical protein
MTPEEEEAFKRIVPQIEYVHLNTYALTRTDVEWSQIAGLSEITPVAIGNELVTRIDDDDEYVSQTWSQIPLPRSVDNSTSKFFPPIGNQSGNSCASWSIAYYMMTNNFALARDLNASYISNRMSPVMLWNLVNAGLNIGAFMFEPVFIATTFGVNSIADYPYNAIGIWSSDTAAWRNGINNKADYFIGEMRVDTTQRTTAPGNLDPIKRQLLNGYVVSVAFTLGETRWERNPFGIWVIPQFHDWTNNSGHAMTIVGYCDDFYFDINGNGIKEHGEFGAFKVANSWGTHNHNEGFIWIMYDAFDVMSSVPGNTNPIFPHPRRYMAVPTYHLLTKSSAVPVLLAEINIETTSKTGLFIEIGFSETNTYSPIRLSPFSKIQRHYTAHEVGASWSPSQAALDGFTDFRNFAAHSFNGVITLDLTNMIEQFSLHGKGEKRFYINVRHSRANSVTIVRDFKLI